VSAVGLLCWYVPVSDYCRHFLFVFLCRPTLLRRTPAPVCGRGANGGDGRPINTTVRSITISDIGYRRIGCILNCQGWKGNCTLISDMPNLWRLAYNVAVAATWHQNFVLLPPSTVHIWHVDCCNVMCVCMSEISLRSIMWPSNNQIPSSRYSSENAAGCSQCSGHDMVSACLTCKLYYIHCLQYCYICWLKLQY